MVRMGSDRGAAGPRGAQGWCVQLAADPTGRKKGAGVREMNLGNSHTESQAAIWAKYS